MALYDPTEADEKRDERLTELTREAADSMTQALAAGLPKTMQLIDEALGEFMQDDQARFELLKKTAAGGSPLTKILSDLIWTEACVFAERELQRLEKEGAEAALEARAEQVAEAWLCPLH